MNDDMRKLIDETKRLDREATPGPWRPEGASIRVNLPGGIEYQWATAAYPRDNNLSAHYRTAAPALAAEVERLDARLAEVERERDEALLTLAAEQGRQEGAPYDNPELVLAMVNGERIRRGLSWRELAAILGVSPSTLTRWTHGKMLSVPAYLLVCKWLNAAINETIDIVDANGPGWCDRCSPDRCDCEDDDTAAPVLAAEVERLDARLAEVERERDEALLTLAAEQGRQEGAPSKRWHYVGNEDGFDEERGEWRRRDGAVKVWWDNGRWIWGRRAQPGVYVAERGQPDDQPARVAMLAADAATG